MIIILSFKVKILFNFLDFVKRNGIGRQSSSNYESHLQFMNSLATGELIKIRLRASNQNEIIQRIAIKIDKWIGI